MYYMENIKRTYNNGLKVKFYPIPLEVIDNYYFSLNILKYCREVDK